MSLTIRCRMCVILFNKVSCFGSWKACLKQADMRKTWWWKRCFQPVLPNEAWFSRFISFWQSLKPRSNGNKPDTLFYLDRILILWPLCSSRWHQWNSSDPKLQKRVMSSVPRSVFLKYSTFQVNHHKNPPTKPVYWIGEGGGAQML